MRKNLIYSLLALMLIWIILMEGISWLILVSGFFLAVICLWFTYKFIPLDKIDDVSFPRLFLYPFYLIGQIYIQGFLVIKMILTGVRVDIVEAKTELKSDFLKAILINSITLTPGSIPLNLDGDTLTVLNLGSTKEEDVHQVVDSLRNRLEKRLIKAQK